MSERRTTFFVDGVGTFHFQSFPQKKNEIFARLHPEGKPKIGPGDAKFTFILYHNFECKLQPKEIYRWRDSTAESARIAAWSWITNDPELHIDLLKRAADDMLEGARRIVATNAAWGFFKDIVLGKDDSPTTKAISDADRQTLDRVVRQSVRVARCVLIAIDDDDERPVDDILNDARERSVDIKKNEVANPDLVVNLQTMNDEISARMTR